MNENEHIDTPAIEVRNLTRNFGALKAVDDISFSVKRGEVVGFLGPNGAGKSTTLRILAGLLPASSGYAFITGLSVATQPDAIKRRIGYMPETNPLPEDMRVEEYLRLRAKLKELPRWVQRQRVQAAMELCNLQHKAKRKIIGTLSKGFRQRVGIADAILSQPDVVIMDEPTIGLDPHQIIGIRQLIDNMRGKMTVILSSHILAEIEVSCDSVIIINHGKLVAQGSPAQLRKTYLPAQRYRIEAKADTAALKQALNSMCKDLMVRREETQANGFTRFTVEMSNEERLGEAIVHKLVTEHKIPIREMAYQEPQLEHVFLAATKQSWRETTEILSPESTQEGGTQA